MFSVNTITYAPQIKQLQVTVRYHNRALNYLKASYPDAREVNGEYYTFSLSDNLGAKYTSYTFTRAEKTGYTYRRLIFENVSFDDVSEIRLNVFYAGDENKENPRHRLYVYRYDFAMGVYDYKAPGGKKYELFTHNP
jgi:hypothetical protein